MRVLSSAVVAVSLLAAGVSAASITEIASTTEDFSTLTAAVVAAGLDETLAGPGTFTVFAPLNSAFEALPEGVVEQLLEPEWKFHLQDVLTYHALDSEVLSTSLADNITVTAINGEDLLINLDPPRVNENAKILVEEGLVDVEADNGVIHGVDNVLLPTSVTSSIVDIGAADPVFSTLVAAVGAAGLADALSGPGPFTLFAPTNDAFAALPEGTVDSLLLPENKDQLVDVLTYHVVPGIVHSSAVAAGDVASLQGAPITVTTDGGVQVSGANVVATDVLANNGIIHVIDGVILPPTTLPEVEGTPTTLPEVEGGETHEEGEEHEGEEHEGEMKDEDHEGEDHGHAHDDHEGEEEMKEEASMEDTTSAAAVAAAASVGAAAMFGATAMALF